GLGLALLLSPWLYAAEEGSTFTKSVQPFFARNCYACHNSKLSTSGLNLEAYGSAASLLQDPGASEKILKKLRAGEMPPKPSPRPNEAELKLVTNWIESELDGRKSDARVMARRLNRVEYDNTVRDLLAIDVRPADDFPQDDSAYGFDNMAQALSVSPLLMEK